MTRPSCVVGIDLGTTNSEVAALEGDRVRVLGPARGSLLPSCVGVDPKGELLVGRAALNQYVLHPERTVRSIKRKMGSTETVTLGDRTFTPAEISALILRTLADTAERQLGQPVEQAVITVPAYFTDAQRQATREAAALAGLAVARILNEPTAASLAYGYGDSLQGDVLVYDLGGGTFDVSIVHMAGEVTEVLASHGNTQLGGDDFDRKLVELLAETFAETHGIDLLQDEHRGALARLSWSAEEAKRRLSSEPFVVVREEALLSDGGRVLHLEREVTREAYEALIHPLVSSTLESVTRALEDANKRPDDLAGVLLVGGSTRTPLVSRLLQEYTGQPARREVHPDLCVALGAGVLASRIAGRGVERVLVDVSPYSFGPSHLGLRDGLAYPYCYKPIIERNTPLPVTRTERYYTSFPGQDTVEIEIFQGDDADALKNIPVGAFTVEGLTPTEDSNEVLCRMSLDLDGMLVVTAVEKLTGKSKQLTIHRALSAKSDAEIATARQQLLASLAGAAREDDAEIFQLSESDSAEADVCVGSAEANGSSLATSAASDESVGLDSKWPALSEEARRLIERSRTLLDKMHDDDKEEAIGLHETITTAIAERDPHALPQATHELKELLFYVEGR